MKLNMVPICIKLLEYFVDPPQFLLLETHFSPLHCQYNAILYYVLSIQRYQFLLYQPIWFTESNTFTGVQPNLFEKFDSD